MMQLFQLFTAKSGPNSKYLCKNVTFPFLFPVSSLDVGQTP